MIVSGIVTLGAVMAILDSTVINVALDSLTTGFDAPFTTIQWVVSAYTLALAAAIPVAGWAGDRFGDREVYLCALLTFTAGSALCAIAWNPGSLIAFRVLQGIGGGLIVPSVTTIITKKAGPNRRGRVMGILGVPLLAAPLFGPILGGYLVDAVSWRAIFLINLPIGAIAILLAYFVLERQGGQVARRLDWLGLSLLSPGLALLIFGFAQSPAHGFGSTRCWLPILVGAMLTGAFFRHSWQATEPLIDVRAFARSRAGAAAVTLLLVATATFGATLVMPIYFQIARGTSALESGLLVGPQALGAMVTMPAAGWLTDRYGAFPLPLCGMPLMIIGIAPFAFVSASTPFALLCGFNFLIGIGSAFAILPCITAAIQALPDGAISRTSTAMNAIDQCGGSIGTALLSVILASAFAQVVPGAEHGGLDSVAGLAGVRHAALSTEMAEAFGSTFLWALVILIAAVAPALALSRGWGATE